MKSILFFLSVSLSASAGNFMSQKMIEEKSSAGFELEASCLRQNPGQKCYDVGANPDIIKEGAIKWKPLYGGAHKAVDECDGKDACEIALASKNCASPKQAAFIDESYKFVYCMDQVDQELILDQAAYNQKVAPKVQAAQYEAGISMAEKSMNCGRRVMASLIVRNAPKNLKTAQIKELIKSYKEVKELLETGSLVTARESIISIVPDGSIVTEADKTALVAELDKCKP